MTDIVERLRICAKYDPDQAEAADLIESLREQLAESQFDFRAVFDISTKREKEIERLRDALMKIEYLDRPQVRGLPRRVSIQEIALAALDNNNG